MTTTCNICPHACELERGETGKCKVRICDGQKVGIGDWYGRCSALLLDKIEKRPFYHLTPGTKYLSVGLYGCSLDCRFCVPGSTLIRTKYGLKRIDQIQDEEEIVVYDSLNQQLVLARVGHVFCREVEEVLELEVDGQKIRLTTGHPVYTKQRGWVKAGDLAPDDEVLCDKTYLEQYHSFD